MFNKCAPGIVSGLYWFSASVPLHAAIEQNPHKLYWGCSCRPFLLPCLSAALISFLALQSSIFLMKETLPSKLANKYARLGQTDEEQGSSTHEGKAVKTSEAGNPMLAWLLYLHCSVLV